MRMFQSTRPCGARHEQIEKGKGKQKVSIHAPMRGATRRVVFRNPREAVSIHAPMRGATRLKYFYRFFCLFQSTRPCGARQLTGIYDTPALIVSIHAPMRGATPLIRDIFYSVLVSIHAPMRGATFLCSFLYLTMSCFNPRAHAGRDLC